MTGTTMQRANTTKLSKKEQNILVALLNKKRKNVCKIQGVKK